MKYMISLRRGVTFQYCIPSVLRMQYDMLQNSNTDIIHIVVINNDIWTRYSRKELSKSYIFTVNLTCIERDSMIFWVKRSFRDHSRDRYSSRDELVTDVDFRKKYL